MSSFSKVYYAKCETGSDFNCDRIWFNPKITVGEISVFSKSPYNSSRLLFVNDRIHRNSNVNGLDYVKHTVLKAEIFFVEYA